MLPVSPVTKKKNTIFQQEIDVNKLLQTYKNSFDIDVSHYFINIDKILLYECQDTGYRFYYPYNIAGDSVFYEHLQKFDWYYMPWKWEHEQASNFIKPNMKVLEIGCGPGDFLLRIKEKLGAQCVGIEFNKKAIEIAEKKGLTVLEESIEQHAILNKEVYDVICSFQVLEHVSDVFEFLKAQIACLKTGGTLILSVPNNDSWLKRSYNVLNMPPHHMGLWNKKSLKNVARRFNLKIKSISFEPMQEYHGDYYTQTMRDLLNNLNFVPKRLWPYIIPIMRFLSSKSYKGFTIQIAYCMK